MSDLPRHDEFEAHLERHAPACDLDLDPAIRRAVLILRSGGVETFESCEGSAGHAFLEPTVRFHGTANAGWHALSVALEHGLPVMELRRYWQIEDGQPVGPQWEMTFRAMAASGPTPQGERG